jgi:predicted kinase
MLMSGKIHIMIGVARSGKSTVCEQLVRKTDNQPRVIVCADDIRLAISGQRFNKLTEDFVKATKLTMIRALFHRNHYVLVDGTHTKLFHIEELAEIDPNFEYTIVDTPVEECIRRAILTQQDDLIPVIQRMDIQLKELLIDFDIKIKNLREKYHK